MAAVAASPTARATAIDASCCGCTWLFPGSATFQLLADHRGQDIANPNSASTSVGVVSTGPASSNPDRDALLSWLKNRLNSDLPQPPEMLWHYTDASGLMGIVEHERLWATQTSFLNDSTELEYGLDLAMSAIASYDRTNLKEATDRFLTGLVDPEKPELKKWLDKHLDVYVTCFSGDGDMLSQWRAYAGRDDAGGYALGLGTRPPLQGWPQMAPGDHEFALRQVLYDPIEQQAACHSLIDGVVELASWCKHPAFEEEREWRIVYVRNNDASKVDVQHRISRGLLVPYVKLELPSPVGALSGHLPLRAINFGPGPEPTLQLLRCVCDNARP
jgi:hypothetical protein